MIFALVTFTDGSQAVLTCEQYCALDPFLIASVKLIGEADTEAAGVAARQVPATT